MSTGDNHSTCKLLYVTLFINMMLDMYKLTMPPTVHRRQLLIQHIEALVLGLLGVLRVLLHRGKWLLSGLVLLRLSGVYHRVLALGD